MSSDDAVGGVTAWCADGRRARFAALAGVAPALALVVMLVAVRPSGHWVAAVVVLALVGFNLFALVDVLLTWRVLAPVDAADVSITTPAMRRVVNFNVVVVFRFNSVVVALLASILIR